MGEKGCLRPNLAVPLKETPTSLPSGTSIESVIALATRLIVAVLLAHVRYTLNVRWNTPARVGVKTIDSATDSYGLSRQLQLVGSEWNNTMSKLQINFNKVHIIKLVRDIRLWYYINSHNNVAKQQSSAKAIRTLGGMVQLAGETIQGFPSRAARAVGILEGFLMRIEYEALELTGTGPKLIVSVGIPNVVSGYTIFGSWNK